MKSGGNCEVLDFSERTFLEAVSHASGGAAPEAAAYDHGAGPGAALLPDVHPDLCRSDRAGQQAGLYKREKHLWNVYGQGGTA